MLDGSGRKIAYTRLQVVDAAGKELTARLEVDSASCAIGGAGGAMAEAVYPVQIDPTFSDANWVSMGGFPGVDGVVSAIVADGSGNFYVGGQFTMAGIIFATNVAKWDGNAWSALGAGLNGFVSALAVSGKDLYVGGSFTVAGGRDAKSLAKWDGSVWSAVEAGMDGPVYALAVSGNDLYAGGSFSRAGGTPANNIAKWDGSAWWVLGSGMDGSVYALVVSGTNLYAGGHFSTQVASASIPSPRGTGTLGGRWVRGSSSSYSPVPSMPWRFPGPIFTRAANSRERAVKMLTALPSGMGVPGQP